VASTEDFVTAQATSAPPSVRTAFAPATPKPIHPRPQPHVSVVIPALDEERNIGWVLQRMPETVDEVIVVDGLSRDATIEVARMVLPQVVIVHEMNRGKGNALRAGFEAATGDVVVMIDADGSMDPADIPSFVDAIMAGHDVAKGSRFMSAGAGSDDMTALRKWGNAGLLLLANVLYRTRHTDLCYGFLAFRKDALRVIRADASGFEIEMQLVARATRAGLRVVEVANHEHARMHGASNLRTIRDGWRVLMTLLGELRWRPREERMPVEESPTLQ
jgi:glycosyltransferase involved in cell wall biosynthesis